MVCCVDSKKENKWKVIKDLLDFIYNAISLRLHMSFE